MRNPLGLRAKIFQMLFFAIFAIILYYKEADNLDNYIQNIRGCIFFIAMNISFSAIFGSINLFSQERPIFIRERLSNTYDTSSYYLGRSSAYLPLEILLPLLLLVVQYFAVHLDNDADSFFATLGGCWLGFFMASAYGLLLSTLFADEEVALSLVPVLIVPLMLVGGFFAPLENVHDFFRVFEYISMFKYVYQVGIQAQFMDDPNGFTFKGQTYEGNILAEGGLFYFAVQYPHNLGKNVVIPHADGSHRRRDPRPVPAGAVPDQQPQEAEAGCASPPGGREHRERLGQAQKKQEDGFPSCQTH